MAICINCSKTTNNPNGKDARRARYFKSIKVAHQEGLEPPFSTPITINRVET